MFKPGKMRKAPDREPTYLYRKISVPAGPDDSQLKILKVLLQQMVSISN